MAGTSGRTRTTRPSLTSPTSAPPRHRPHAVTLSQGSPDAAEPVGGPTGSAGRLVGWDDLQAQGRLDLVGACGLLPGEVRVGAPEVPIGGGLLVDRPAQVEVAHD